MGASPIATTHDPAHPPRRPPRQDLLEALHRQEGAGRQGGQLRGRRGGGLRLPRPQRRGQDDDHQDAHRAHTRDVRLGHHLRRSGPLASRDGARRLPPREPLRLPVPLAARVRDAVRTPQRHARQGAHAEGREGPRARRHGTRDGPGGARALEGDAPARRPRRGARSWPRAPHPRRADERPRPDGPEGGARHHPRGGALRPHGLLLDAHPLGRRDALRSRLHAAQG